MQSRNKIQLTLFPKVSYNRCSAKTELPFLLKAELYFLISSRSCRGSTTRSQPDSKPSFISELRSRAPVVCMDTLSHFTTLFLIGILKNCLFFRGYGGFGALGHSVYHRELLPKMVQGSWDEEMCHIATSGTHTAAITKSGKLYIWGRDEGDGRLGLGPGRGPDFAGGLGTPTEVKVMPEPVAAVSCGGFFTMALTEGGQLWNWGANSNYELGRGDKIGGWKPQPVPSLKDVRLVQIASGGYHSLALTDKGEVLSWGHGGHGQLGHSSLHSRKVPEPVEALANEKVTYIACGGSSSAAVTDKGSLYMWGNAADSQLGVPGLPELQSSPIEVKFLSDDDGLGDHKVLSVSVGASHAMCLFSRSSC
ncbi:hypothetical protein SASPL_116932 [Salvia splendens]|uniref:RCC1-like domain-containing protein n=1 Tax=Salvia splendens TaxID=180675 RepID=A0A8X8XTW8_SALSN|nr:hypothetical protein SASPL_116932 [Salvia splendens]